MDEAKQAESLRTIARDALDCVLDMVREMKDESKTEEERDEDRERIREDPLSVQVREGWHNPGEDGEVVEFEILLGTGGPATRIIGDLNGHGEPVRAVMQSQDWGTLWTTLHNTTEDERDLLLDYCRCFWFGEG